jgi:hypothetical protein
MATTVARLDPVLSANTRDFGRGMAKSEGRDGTTYVFSKGERVPADHPVVLEKPHAFIPLEDD